MSGDADDQGQLEATRGDTERRAECRATAQLFQKADTPQTTTVTNVQNDKLLNKFAETAQLGWLGKLGWLGQQDRWVSWASQVYQINPMRWVR